MGPRYLLILSYSASVMIFARAGKTDPCPDLPNYVEELPGLGTKNVLCNYAGFTLGSPYFYWFMVKMNTTNMLDVPLLVYLGSGVESSLIHAFGPGGPLRVTLTGNDFKLNLTASLIDTANIIYIEQPGFYSFSREKFTGEYTAYVFLNEILRFMDSFVTYNGLRGVKRVYIFAEGHMVKIGAMLANPLYTKNRKFTVKGLIINNGIFDLSKNVVSLASLSSGLGFIPEDLLHRIEEETYVSPEMIVSRPEEAFEQWNYFGDVLQEVSGLPQFLDNLRDVRTTNPMKDIEGYLSQEIVQLALHIRQFTKWEMKPKEAALKRAIPAILNSSTYEFNQLISVPLHADIMFTIGVYSPRSSIDGFQQWVNTAQWGGIEKIFLANRVFVTENNSIMYVKEKNQIVYAIYPEEGKILGTFSLHLYLSSMIQFIKTQILHGLEEDDAELELILKKCNGNGKYNLTTEECLCYHNQTHHFYGSDCSIVPAVIHQFPFSRNISSYQWRYFYIDIPDVPTVYELEYSLTNSVDSVPKQPLLMAIGLNMTKLPLGNDNVLLSRKREIIIGEEIINSDNNQFILGIKNDDTLGEYQVTIKQRPLELPPGRIFAVVLTVALTTFALLAISLLGYYCLCCSKQYQIQEIKV